jgi:glycosyltransferase involved in cell wall biosynthesis
MTIITATYNALPTLREAYASLSSQTHTDWEWIVVDGASTDGTVEWLSALADSRVNWKSEKDQGIYDALNKGIARATGEVIGFLHADDLLAGPEVLTQIAARFQDVQIDGIYGDLQYVSVENGRVIRNWKSSAFTVKKLQYGWMPPHPTCYFKKSVYEEIGTFDTSFRIAADYDFLLRSFASGKFQFAYLPLLITRMRIGGASSKWQNLVKKSREDMRALRKNGMGFPLFVLLRKVGSKFGQFF